MLLPGINPAWFSCIIDGAALANLIAKAFVKIL